MFTGIVEGTGCVKSVRDTGGHLRVRVAPDRMWHDLALGESVAVSGVCLTVVTWDEQAFEVELSRETIAKTAPRWREGEVVNLERALRADGRFGGHVVSGHVDGIGEILDVREEPGAFTVTLRAPRELARYLVPKGSVAVDGVSLTVVDVGGPAGSRADLAPEEFTLWLVPHTLEVTSLRAWRPGARVNLEADPVAKYLERLVALREIAPGAGA